MTNWLAQNMAALAAIESIVTSLGIVAGGIWAYRQFRTKRDPNPKARIRHSVTHRRLNANNIWLRVELGVENCGNSLLKLTGGLTRLSQVLPSSGSLPERLPPPFSRELSWPQLFDDERDWTEMRIEPGEDDSVSYDFILAGDITTVLIYSHVGNRVEGKEQIGWQKATVYEMSDDDKHFAVGDEATGAQAAINEPTDVPRLDAPASGKTAPSATREEEMTRNE